MPNYDYRCSDCGQIFEKFHGMNENPSFECPNCSSANVSKKIGKGAGIVFKGSGFYITDYKRKEEQQKSQEGSAEKSSTEGSGESAKESGQQSSQENQTNSSSQGSNNNAQAS